MEDIHSRVYGVAHQALLTELLKVLLERGVLTLTDIELITSDACPSAR